MSIPRSFFGTITSQISLYMVSHKIGHSGGGQQSWAVLQRITILAMHIGMASSMQCYDGDDDEPKLPRYIAFDSQMGTL